jgi:hypothetical protein
MFLRCFTSDAAGDVLAPLVPKILGKRGVVMRVHLFFAAATGSIVLLGAACSSNPPPSAKAARVERLQCEPGETGQQEEQLIRSTKVLEVEPLYSHVRTSNNDAEERVNGAKLVVRPPQGISGEQMTRLLQCHSARVLLGQVNAPSFGNDPYWLPDTWVSIDVKPENGNFAITLSADSVRDNLKVFSRANRYGEQQMATQPELP